MDKRQRPIGVMDSGIGGISVLRELVAEMPHEQVIYYGDSLHAPYGERSEVNIRELTTRACDILLTHDVKALLLACNTATSATAAYLREMLDIPIIGMEPALKPASKLVKNGIALVMATPATLSQEKFRKLHRVYGNQADTLPCPGLARLIEDGDDVSDYLTRLFEPYLKKTVDVVVLGCTHYSLIKNDVQARFPGSYVIDGNIGTVKQLKRVLTGRDLSAESGEVCVTLMNSQPNKISLMRQLLECDL